MRDLAMIAALLAAAGAGGLFLARASGPAQMAPAAVVQGADAARAAALPAAMRHCPGCSALESLAEAFARRAEESRHRLTTLTATADPAAEAATQDAAAALAAAPTARAWVDRCRANPICARAGDRPMDPARACEARVVGPLAPHLRTLLEPVRGLRAQAQACGRMGCPGADCASAQGLRADAAALLTALDVLFPGVAPEAGAPAPPPAALGALRRLVDDTRYGVRFAPLLIGEGRAESYGLLSRLLEDLERGAQTVAGALPASDGGDPLAVRMQDYARRLAALRRAVAAVGAGGGGAQLWETLADAAGGLLATASELESSAALALAADAPPCPEAPGEAGALRTALDGAVALLDTCLARAACAPGLRNSVEAEPMIRLSTLTPQTPDPRGAARALVETAASRFAEAAGAWRVEESPPPSFAADRGAYAAGEPIAITLDGRGRRCLAAGAVSVALAREGGAPLRTIEAGGAAERRLELFTPAPLEPGAYELRLSAERDAPVLARRSVTVEPMPPGCDGFTGQWRTGRGALRLVVRDGRARGAFEAEGGGDGLVLGWVEQGVLSGQWQAGGTSGGMRLRLAPGGGAFAGGYGATPDAVSGAGEWSGVCASASSAANVSR